MKPLTVYKASAGSGKTFRLTVEYIKLLIKNPFAFKTILAVTFTNKATEEMKMRILSQLYGLWKTLPDSDGYMKEITSSLNLSESQVSRQAGIALISLIHNYNYFRVETIDSFFQSILRNLAHELDLTANLRIGLNDIQVEEQAVDQLIESLSKTSVILQWLISYIFSNIEEDKSWYVIGQVKQFGRNIFQDFYKEISDDLNGIVTGKNFFERYTKQLRTVREEADKRMAEYAEEFERKTAEAGLTTTSYAGKKSGIGSYFNKIKSNDYSDKKCINATLMKCMDSVDYWATKNSPDKDAIFAVVNGGLMQLLHDAEKARPQMWKLRSSVDVTLRHLNKLRLLNSIEVKVREINDEANIFLLSDTQYLLHTLIKDTDSPFIFEKAGCQLEHIMIDEFQDTSVVQWQNFKVLLKECMSRACEDNDTIRNLIVGDVKQSIYRWRSGDWRLLNNIEAQFASPKENIDAKTMEINRRSEYNVVKFNNAFFSLAVKQEHADELKFNTEDTAEELLTAYKNVRQEPHNYKEKNGFVKITLLPNEGYETNTLANIEETIDLLRSKGAETNDIAILIRYNRHIPLIADYFMDKRPDISIVSDEAFRLDSSTAVNTIIQALRLLTHPTDTLTKANLAVTYHKSILQDDMTDSDILTRTGCDDKDIDNMLPPTFINNCEELAKKPLFDIIEHIFTSFELNRLDNQSAYVCAFYDQVTDFISNNPGDIDSFLDVWNETVHSKTIQSSEINGIRLISIHKSKGLEFAHIIIPFCDWRIENPNTTIWCNPKEEPFNNLPLVPVDYNKKLMDTIYADDFKNEHLQNTVDNLNLLYVAFTRAKKNLFVVGKKGKDKAKNRSEIIAYCLDGLSKELDGSSLTGVDNDAEATVFSYGELYTDSKKKDEKSANVFLHDVETHKMEIQTPSYEMVFKQSNKSEDFIKGKDIEGEKGDKYIKMGNILHKLFSMIRTTDDIDGVLKQLEFDGVLYDKDITVGKMRSMLAKILVDKRVIDWFSPHWQVFNECDILFIDNENKKAKKERPDRVITDGKEVKVIDFKFGKPQERYQSQVQSYMKLLIEMGYHNVHGYLWFVYSNKIEEVFL